MFQRGFWGCYLSDQSVFWKSIFGAPIWVISSCFEGVRLWFLGTGSVCFSKEKSELLFSKRISLCLGVIRGCYFQRGSIRVSEERGRPHQKSFGKHYYIKKPHQQRSQTTTFSFPLPKVNFEHISLLVIFNFKFWFFLELWWILFIFYFNFFYIPSVAW